MFNIHSNKLQGAC